MTAPKSGRGRHLGIAAAIALAAGVGFFATRGGSKPAPAPAHAAEPSPPIASAFLPPPAQVAASSRKPPLAAPAKEVPSLGPTIAEKIARAVERAPRCLQKLAPQSDALWVVDLAQDILHLPELGEKVDEAKRALGADSPLGVLVDSDAAAYAVPKLTADREATPEAQLLLTLTDSLACRGGHAPSERVRKFVDATHDGYLLTHQFLVIEWAERVGCDVPGEWRRRRAELVERVVAELRRARGFSDLFAEQVFVVELAGRSDQVEPEWIARILNAQDSNGCWTDAEATDIAFGDGTIHSTQSEDHTTSLALYAIARFRADRP